MKFYSIIVLLLAVFVATANANGSSSLRGSAENVRDNSAPPIDESGETTRGLAESDQECPSDPPFDGSDCTQRETLCPYSNNGGQVCLCVEVESSPVERNKWFCHGC